MKAILIVFALVALSAAMQLRNHDYWYTAQKAIVVKKVPLGDVAWNYCDMKCTYLEKIFSGKDFVVIPFSGGTFSLDFAACYIQQTNNGTTTYKLWNTAGTNAYYETNCGGQTEDYYALTTGASPKYKISGDILGVGIGTEINY